MKTKFQQWQAKLRGLHTRHLPRGSIRRSIVSGGFWSLAGSVFSKICGLLGSIIFVRLLGKTDFGKWSLILTTVAMFAQYAGLGLSTPIVRYMALLKDKDPKRAGSVLSFCMLFGIGGTIMMSLVCFCGAKWLANSFYSAPELFMPISIASIFLFFMVMATFVQNALAGFEDFRSIAMTNIIQGLAILVVIVPLTARFGLVGIVAGWSASYAIAMAVCFNALRKNCNKRGIHFHIRGIWREGHLLWRYVLPGLTTTLVTAPATAMSQAMVANIPGGFSGLGSYGVAASWQGVVAFVPQNMRTITLPMLSRLHGEGNHRRFLKALWANIGLNGGIALFCGLPLMAMSPWILSLYGPDFRQDWDILVILIGTVVFQAINDVVTQVTAALEKMWWNLFVHIIWATVLVGGSFLLIQNHGVRGYVWAIALATFCHMCINSVASLIWLKKDAFIEVQSKADGQMISQAEF